MSRKYIIPEKRPQRVATANVTILPPVDGLLAEALNIIGSELNRYSLKVKQGKSLDLSEARVVQGYLKSLVEISRESRERDRDEKLDEIDDQKLLELAKKALELEGKKPPSEPE